MPNDTPKPERTDHELAELASGFPKCTQPVSCSGPLGDNCEYCKARALIREVRLNPPGIDGYRELAMKCASFEEENDRLRAELADARRDSDRHEAFVKDVLGFKPRTLDEAYELIGSRIRVGDLDRARVDYCEENGAYPFSGFEVVGRMTVRKMIDAAREAERNNDES